MKTVLWTLVALFWVGVSSGRTAAAPLVGSWMAGRSSSDIVAGSSSEEFVSASAIFHAFTGSEMNDTYGQMYGADFQGGLQLERGVALRLGVGLFAGGGDPLYPDPTWEVSSSSLGMTVAKLGGSFLYQFSGGESGRAIVPYAGVGLNGYLGFERTSVVISRAPEGEYEWNDTRYRHTWGGHALAGTTFKLTELVRGLVEIQWTQGVDGSDVEQSFSDAEIAEGWLEVEKAVQRPNFNFTGWSVSVGAQW